MKEGQKPWTRDELILAINRYCKLPFRELDKNTKEAKELAGMIGRTSNSVALKLVNFSSLDPSLQARGIKGMGNQFENLKYFIPRYFNSSYPAPRSAYVI